MDSLERVFFGFSAFAALLALGMFALFFDVGDMVLAAVKGPGALQEWAWQQGVRRAERQGAPGEIMPFGGLTDGRLPVQGTRRRKAGDEGWNQVPQISLEVKVDRQRKLLKDMGFADEEYLQMESFYRADRGHLPALLDIDDLTLRGDAPRALEELDQLIAQLDPRNLRALYDLLTTRGKLLGLLNAPPEKLYEHVVQAIELRLKILAIEIKGYQGIPAYKPMLAQAQTELARLEAHLDEISRKKSDALRFFSTGVFSSGGFDPSFSRLVKAAVARRKEEGKLHQVDVDDIAAVIDAQTAPPPEAPAPPPAAPDPESQGN